MRWEELERIELEAEDAQSFAVGDMIFGHVIVRVQHVASDHSVVSKNLRVVVVSADYAC